MLFTHMLRSEKGKPSVSYEIEEDAWKDLEVRGLTDQKETAGDVEPGGSHGFFTRSIVSHPLLIYVSEHFCCCYHSARVGLAALLYTGRRRLQVQMHSVFVV
jgi:hypothetical protein